MTSSPNPTWYDILGVSPDATPGEIKAAWRDATDKFEPGSGQSQFRLFNDAADVLLDPAKRAEYDESLGGSDTLVEEAAESVVEETVVDEPVIDLRKAESPDSQAEEPTDAPTKSARRSPRWLTLLVYAVLPLLTVIAIAAALVLRAEAKGDDAASQVAPEEATAVLERALPAVLSYDYRHMDADRSKATKYLTSSYRSDYTKTFELLVKGEDGQPGPVVKSKTVVKATLLNTGVVDADEHRVRLLAFVNQVSTKDGTGGQLFQNRVAVTMVEKDGKWLIDALDSL